MTEPSINPLLFCLYPCNIDVGGGRSKAPLALVFCPFFKMTMSATFVYFSLLQSYRVWNPRPPHPHLSTQGLNSFKKYFKSCNKITSKEMRRMRGQGS